MIGTELRVQLMLTETLRNDAMQTSGTIEVETVERNESNKVYYKLTSYVNNESNGILVIFP